MQSPAVTVQEASTQHYIPNVTNETACFVGHFERGPVNVPVYITNINDFKFIFGRAVGDHYNDWYQVYNYLQYCSGVWVARSVGTSRANSNNGSELTIDRYSQWEELYPSLPVSTVRLIARTPGTWGNLLSIAIIAKPEYDDNVLLGYDRYAKDTFTYFEDGYFGVAVFRDGLLVETFYKPFDSLEDLNAESAYLYSKVDTSSLPTEILELIDFIAKSGILDMGDLTTKTTTDDMGLISNGITQTIDLGPVLSGSFGGYIFYDSTIIDFQNGYNMPPSEDDLAYTYSLFEDPEYFDIDIVIGNERDNTLAINLAETRRDCMAFIGFPTVLISYLKLLMGAGNNPIPAITPDGFVIGLNEFIIPVNLTDVAFAKFDEYIATIPESQFCHFTMNVKVQYDIFTNKNRLVNVAGDTAGLKAEASLKSPWTVGAGLERGVVKNTIRMFMNLSASQKLRYYKKALNYFEKGALVTQKTFTTRPNSFNRVNIRSLFNHIEKETKYVLRNIVFDENTLRVRQNVATHVKRYLQDIKTNGGIESARVNVYPDGERAIVCEVTVKPTYVAETISIRVTNAGTNDFTSVVS